MVCPDAGCAIIASGQNSEISMPSFYWLVALHIGFFLVTMVAGYIFACRFAMSRLCVRQSNRQVALGLPMVAAFAFTFAVGLLLYWIELRVFLPLSDELINRMGLSFLMVAGYSGVIALFRARAVWDDLHTSLKSTEETTTPNLRCNVEGGFTLVELSIVMAIIGLTTFFALSATLGLTKSARNREAVSKIAAIDAAFVTYVATNSRLPCPADGSIASGVANAGVESRNAATGDCLANQINGVVPWVTMGITEADATDPWLDRFTYRVAATDIISLTRDNALKMTDCDPAGTGGAATTGAGTGVILTCRARPATCNLAGLPGGCTPPASFLLNKGLQIRNEAGTVIMNPALGTGAAYVVISHGENIFGGFSSSTAAARGVLGAGPGPGENQNANGVGIQAFYVDAQRSEAAATYFDDYLLRPSLSTVIMKAQLWARAVTS